MSKYLKAQDGKFLKVPCLDSKGNPVDLRVKAHRQFKIKYGVIACTLLEDDTVVVLVRDKDRDRSFRLLPESAAALKVVLEECLEVSNAKIGPLAIGVLE